MSTIKQENMKKYIYILVAFIACAIFNSCGVSNQTFLDPVYYAGQSNIDPMVKKSGIATYNVNGEKFGSLRKANDYARIERKFQERENQLQGKIDSLQTEITNVKGLLLALNNKPSAVTTDIPITEKKDEIGTGSYYSTGLYSGSSSYSSYRPKTVHVKAHTRVQNGKVVHVKAHTRSAPRRR